LETSPDQLYHANNDKTIKECKKNVNIRLKVSSIKAVKKLAAERECLPNVMFEEALEMLFQKYGQEVK